jgi:2-hydroxy-3-keto-5-methylthiopentenyl-1-phosphate phosphatase
MTEPAGRKPVVFCDFDGTITENDNIIAIMKHFNPPGWEAIVDQILKRERSVQDGVGDLFSRLPVHKRSEITDYAVRQARIRAGFREFLELCEEGGIDFYVTSGGIDFFVHPILAPLPIKRDHIFCNGSDFSGEYIRITWPHSCDDRCANGGCGMCKTRIMRRFPPERHYRIVIGDSVTDLEAAKLADLVFARSHLADHCAKTGMHFVPYETFYEIADYLRKEVM